MSPQRFRSALLASVFAGAAAIASAQAPAAPAAPAAQPAATPDDRWKTATELDKVDFTGLSAAQKETALSILRSEGCTCGCGMKLAECRVNDRNCPASPKLAAAVIQGVKDGKSVDAIKSSYGAAYQKATPPPPPPTLGAAVEIPIAGAPWKGAADAKVTIVEFSDFQCPFCSQVVAWADSIVAAYPKDVKLVFKQYPLPMHQNAKIAAQASLAAHAQGKFWPMHDKMFANFRTINRDNILAWAKEAGLEMTKFTKDMDDPKTAATVDKDMAEGSKAGVQGTPSFFVNGKKYNGARDLNSIKPIIEAELKPGAKIEAPAAKAPEAAPATK